MSELTHGRVYMIDLGSGIGPKPLLVVSNNRRNGAFGDALAVRITTTPKPSIASVVELSAADAPLTGRVLCDAFIVIYPDEVLYERGAVSPPTMRNVETGLKHSLSLR